MITKHGDLFTSAAPAYGHGVNCAGVMGAGIAKQFKEKYPHNYKNYRAACLAGQLKPGQIAVNREKGKFIVNMASQNKPGRDATYHWLFEAALTTATQAVEMGIDRVAVPQIGAGIGGLDWWKVQTILLAVETIANEDIEKFNWEVWIYDK